MRLPGLDPEVLADLRRREASERDPSRSRETSQAFGVATVVEHWPCRGGCNMMVGVTQAAVDAFATLNAQLVRRREQPMAKGKVVWCPACKLRDDEIAAMQRQREVAARRPQQQTELGIAGQKRRM
jgi:hypothetical protein